MAHRGAGRYRRQHSRRGRPRLHQSAADCALNVMLMPIDGTGSVLSFNAATCYPTPAGTSTISVASTNPASGVAIAVTPADNNGLTNGNTPFNRTYNNGTAVTLTAPLTAAGNAFISWTGCGSTSGASGQICSITPNVNVTVTANYSTPPATATLTIDSTSPASGVVIAATPPDNTSQSSVTTPGALVYNVGTAVTLTAPTTAGGNPFASWTGCPSSSANVCHVTVSTNLTITANYTPPPVTFTLTLASTNPASGVAIANTPADNNTHTSTTTPGSLVFNTGTAVTLTAPTTVTGNTFSSWTNCPSATANVCHVTVTANSTITANYITTFTLTIESTNPTSGTAITVTPNDNNGAGNGTTTFTRVYTSGATVTLVAPATSGGNPFVNWTGCTSATTETCNETVSANATLVANYTATPPTVNINVASTNPASGTTITASPTDNNAHSSVVTPGTLNYNASTAVTLTAPATAGGNAFVAWLGCDSATTETCNITPTTSRTVTATYAAPPVTFNISMASTNPASGVVVANSPNDNSSKSSVTTPGTLNFNTGTVVTLTAPTTAGGNPFASFTNCPSAAANVCTITVTANTTITANYTPPPPAVTLTVLSTNPASGVGITASPMDNNGNTSVTTPGSLLYNVNTEVTLIAPGTAGGNAFVNWTGCDVVSGVVCNIAPAANRTATANYAAPPATATLTVRTSPNEGAAITVTPNDNNGHGNGTTAFTRVYNVGASVTLVAPSTFGGAAFLNWMGCTTATTETCSVTVGANVTLTATYAPPPVTETLTDRERKSRHRCGDHRFAHGCEWKHQRRHSIRARV